MAETGPVAKWRLLAIDLRKADTSDRQLNVCTRARMNKKRQTSINTWRPLSLTGNNEKPEAE
jgi:hypothetical protein